MYKTIEMTMKRKASKAPLVTPSITAKWSNPEEAECLLLVKMVTWGVSIEGVDETSLHVIVEKERQRLPDVLQGIGLFRASECRGLQVTTTLCR